MPRGTPRKYRLNFKVYFGHGSLESINDRDLTEAEFVERLETVAKDLTAYAASFRAEMDKPLAERKL